MPLEHTHTHTRTRTHLCRVYTKIKCHSKFSGSYYATPEDEAEAEEVEADSEVYLADAAASIACDFCAFCASVHMCVCVRECV